MSALMATLPTRTPSRDLADAIRRYDVAEARLRLAERDIEADVSLSTGRRLDAAVKAFIVADRELAAAIRLASDAPGLDTMAACVHRGRRYIALPDDDHHDRKVLAGPDLAVAV